MLIIPVENRPDWRHPPVVTVLIILVNVWVYFGLLEGDEQAYADARQTYLASGLIEREADHYRAYVKREWPSAELPEESRFLVEPIITDLAFDRYLQKRMQDDPAWQRARASFERERNRVSWIRLGLVPADAAWWSYLTSMFLHGGVDHLAGNMAFLFLFGFALERLLGPAGYAAVYLLGGLGGGAVHVMVNAGSFVPTIGASGAVSALMGAYLAVYRLRRIRFFYSVLVYFGEFRAPALVVLPLWLVKELHGYLYGDAGIAYWDHIGGLVTGAGLGWAATGLSRQVDDEYLESTSRQAASRARVEQLDALVDGFKYDQARSVAAAHLSELPDDAATWRKYLELLGSRGGGAEYHKAVQRLLARAGPRTGPEMAAVIESAYRGYVAGTHPKPALNDPRLLCALGEMFARQRKLDHARRIANSLLRANRREPELASLLSALGSALAEAGSGTLADHYRRELKVRFEAPADAC